MPKETTETQNEMTKFFGGHTVPTEILLFILQFLSPEDLQTIHQVAKSWNKALENEFFWKTMLMRKLGFNFQSQESQQYFKKIYYTLYKIDQVIAEIKALEERDYQSFNNGKPMKEKDSIIANINIIKQATISYLPIAQYFMCEYSGSFSSAEKLWIALEKLWIALQHKETLLQFFQDIQEIQDDTVMNFTAINTFISIGLSFWGEGEKKNKLFFNPAAVLAAIEENEEIVDFIIEIHSLYPSPGTREAFVEFMKAMLEKVSKEKIISLFNNASILHDKCGNVDEKRYLPYRKHGQGVFF